MKHYKCFIRMIDCLDDEVPMFTRGLWGLCVLAPYAVMGMMFGYKTMFLLLFISINIATISLMCRMIWESCEDTIKHQCRTLPTAFKKCWECRRG